MKPLGIISGTVPLQAKGIFSNLRQETVETPFGRAQVFCAPGIAFIPRHGKDPRRHILPHLINHPANLAALKQLGAGEVLGVNSTGSLKRRIKPGQFVVPDDYITLAAGPTIVREKPVHITPVVNAEVRRKLLAAARDCGIEAVDGGVYWQTAGPRLETRAEVAMMSQFADLVGMTMAGEAICAQEMELPYASICSIDNYAHGLVDRELSQEQIIRQAERNAAAILRILNRYAERRALPGAPA